MVAIPVFKAERDAGLAELVRANASVAYTTALRLSASQPVSEQAMARLLSRAQAGQTDLDLHHLHTILVTTGWNRNDDVFDPIETWVARQTPVHKQLNYEHDCAQILGHIISCSALDDAGQALADDTVMDDLPAKFHIATAAVLYKFWDKPELQKRMDDLLGEIAKGEWFVSMECLFSGFDYALRGTEGDCRIVARNEQTAFLTKHLRAYKGTGQYGDYKVGRLMRNIIFSGKGFVRQPANPESVILPEPETFSTTGKELITDFKQLCATQVYDQVATTAKAEIKSESETNMATELETIQKQLEVLKAENDSLKIAARDSDVKNVKAQLDNTLAEKTKSDEQLAAVKKSLEDATKEVQSITAKLAETEKNLVEVKAELNGIYAEQKKMSRLAKVQATLKVKADDAEGLKKAAALAESLADLPDEKFEAVLASMDMMTMPPATNNPADGNTTFPHGKAKDAPKQTPAPYPPKQTNAPAPMAGKGAVEDDAAGEKAAAAADLAAAQANSAPALQVAIDNDGVTEVAKSVAAFFGMTETK